MPAAWLNFSLTQVTSNSCFIHVHSISILNSSSYYFQIRDDGNRGFAFLNVTFLNMIRSPEKLKTFKRTGAYDLSKVAENFTSQLKMLKGNMLR